MNNGMMKLLAGLLSYVVSPFVGLVLGAIVGAAAFAAFWVADVLVAGLGTVGVDMVRTDVVVVCATFGFFSFMLIQPLVGALVDVAEVSKDR